jgi:coenzyme F420-dependent glucose-6-phosphate dehydrogenase
MTATFRYNPAVVAQAFGTLGCLYPGRTPLGIGTGEALNEVAVSRIEWPAFKERFARLREAVRLMRELWAGERLSFDGDYYQTTNATVYDRPDTPIPVYIAAGGPVVARYAGRAGDGFICTSGKGMDLYISKLLPAVNEGLAAADRDPGSIDKTIEIKLSYDRPHPGAGEHPVLGAAGAIRGAETRPGRPHRDGRRRRRALPRAGHLPLDRRLRPRRRRRPDQTIHRRRV